MHRTDEDIKLICNLLTSPLPDPTNNAPDIFGCHTSARILCPVLYIRMRFQLPVCLICRVAVDKCRDILLETQAHDKISSVISTCDVFSVGREFNFVNSCFM